MIHLGRLPLVGTNIGRPSRKPELSATAPAPPRLWYTHTAHNQPSARGTHTYRPELLPSAKKKKKKKITGGAGGGRGRGVTCGLTTLQSKMTKLRA